MVSSVYWGKIRPDKLKNWVENKEPYDILEQNYKVNIGGWNFL